MKDKINSDFIQFYAYFAPNRKKWTKTINEDNYTLFYNKKSKAIYKARSKDYNLTTFLPLYFVVYLSLKYIPNELFPYNQTIILYTLTIVFCLMSCCLGFYLSFHGYKDITRVHLSEKEVKKYLQKGNKLYVRQLITMFILISIVVTCIICLDIYQSKWWCYGAVAMSFFIGSIYHIFTKTRFLIYKNQLEVINTSE